MNPYLWPQLGRGVDPLAEVTDTTSLNPVDRPTLENIEVLAAGLEVEEELEEDTGGGEEVEAVRVQHMTANPLFQQLCAVLKPLAASLVSAPHVHDTLDVDQGGVASLVAASMEGLALAWAGEEVATAEDVLVGASCKIRASEVDFIKPSRSI
jgi:hypothetical protein